MVSIVVIFMDSRELGAGDPGFQEAPDSSASQPGSATNFISFGLGFFFPLHPSPPKLPLNPGESKELGERPELDNPMRQPVLGPGGERPVLRPEHSTPALGPAAAALDGSSLVNIRKRKAARRAHGAGKAGRSPLDQKGVHSSLSPEKPGLWGAPGPPFADLSGEPGARSSGLDRSC